VPLVVAGVGFGFGFGFRFGVGVGIGFGRWARWADIYLAVGRKCVWPT